MDTAEESDKYAIVAAIDFGTTFSGYAFSFKNDKENIKIFKNWGDVMGFPSYQTPTTVLTKANGDFAAFGYEAEKTFTDENDDSDDDGDSDSSDDDGKHCETKMKSDVDYHDGCSGYNLYRHFKMVLHKKEKLTTKTAISSTTGQISPAIDIFTHALRYLKNHLLNELSKEVRSPPSIDLIKWVITVPAIWTEDSKQFMREAAFRSGCIPNKDSKQLVIALEPEAASFFCRHLHLANFEGEKGLSFPSGTQYLILDCGGGTNDMVVHEVVLDYKVKEVFAVTGGSNGGTEIDCKFVDLLKDILGQEFIEFFKQNKPSQWLSFISKFELAKKVVIPDGESKLNVELPYSMAKIYAKRNPGKKLKRYLKSLKSKGIGFSNGVLVLEHEVALGLFTKTVQNIVDDVKSVFNNSKVKHLDYIFMVGGFSESKILQEAIKDELGKMVAKSLCLMKHSLL